ncbi:MAG: hypothetical protein DMD78_29180 [Candidatus Rokuibacteriota bacterium]|nr:MAG: hypothetical protein DMD78_29180 [Candidatus Rokubacteria bacterium]
MVGDGPPSVGNPEGDVERVPRLDDGRFVGKPVVGSIGDVVPNGWGVKNGDGVPLGDCGVTVVGDDEGGNVCGVVVPV